MEFPRIDDVTRLKRLELPEGRLAMVLDTDTANEIDDQFALTYALLSPDRLDVEAIYAAPFHNSLSSGPGDGMEKSYGEILRVLDRLGEPRERRVFKGSDRYLPAPDQPVRSAAADDLIRRASQDRDGLLYVVAIGAITNVASAILTAPEIIDRIVVVWLGGQPDYWHHTREFNLAQDTDAARVVLNCGVPLVLIPCKGAAELLRTTVQEVEHFIKGRGEIGDYLHGLIAGVSEGKFVYSRVIWDIATIAYLLNPEWVPTTLVHSPILTDQVTWSRDAHRHLIRMATDARRDAIFSDLFGKIRGAAK